MTANKQVIAAHGPALVALARERGVALRFEAAVGGAVPVIRGVQQGLAADTVTRMAGVINGTSNYVLERMELGGLTLQEAVADAQARGFAEAESVGGPRWCRCASQAGHPRRDGIPDRGGARLRAR